MTVRNQVKNKIVSLGFNNIEPQTLAAQLTYIEWKFLRRINFTDYKTYAIKNTLQDNPRLERSIQFFNGLSTWIQCMVLSKMTPKQRAEIIHKFLDVAKVSEERARSSLLKIDCLSSIWEICKTSIPVWQWLEAYLIVHWLVYRKPWPAYQQKISKWDEHCSFFSSLSAFSFSVKWRICYRRILTMLNTGEVLRNAKVSKYRSCKVFHPSLSPSAVLLWFSGVHLKDIISLHVALQDRLEYDLINFRKLVQLSITFRTLTNLQVSVPPIQPNQDLINLLTVRTRKACPVALGDLLCSLALTGFKLHRRWNLWTVVGSRTKIFGLLGKGAFAENRELMPLGNLWERSSKFCTGVDWWNGREVERRFQHLHRVWLSFHFASPYVSGLSENSEPLVHC